MSCILSAFADESGKSTEEQIDALKRNKISHVDLRNVDGFNIVDVTPEHAEQVREKLDAAGLRAGMFGSPIGKIDIADDVKKDLDRLQNLGKISGILGCNAVRIFSYYNAGNAPEETWRQESLRRLRLLRDLAQDLGLVLYHENERHIFGDPCKRVLALADALHDGKTFRLIFDFDNYQQSGDDVWDNWTKLSNRTDAFHLKDSDKQNQHVPIGEGNGQARKILEAALKQGWKGPLSLEPHLARSPAVMATGPSGQANVKLKDMTPPQCFDVAAQTAHRLFKDIGAKVI